MLPGKISRPVFTKMKNLRKKPNATFAPADPGQLGHIWARSEEEALGELGRRASRERATKVGERPKPKITLATLKWMERDHDV
jgi:hypothetical protein